MLPRGTGEREIEFLVEDQILGPARISHGRLLPRATQINTLFVRDDRLYLDLSQDAIVESDDVRIPLDQALAGLEHSIRYNFRGIEDIVITIDGSIPFVPAYRSQSIGN